MFSSRPLYRWKSFWLGVLVLMFLASAWTGSLSQSSYAGLRAGPLTWRGISSAEARIKFTTAIYRPTSYIDPSRIVFGTHPLPRPKEPIWFPAPFEIVHAPNSIADQYYFNIAHWLLITLFLLPWTAFLAWRWRRISRMLPSEKPKGH